jgi:hypothetical protein
MPDSSNSAVARRLAEQAEAVCRHYLPNGRREGRYWLVGDVHNTPGRSLFVRLSGSDTGPRSAGRWTDAATLEYGDLLDLIAAARNLDGIGEAVDEARRFLGLARSAPSPPASPPASVRPATGFASARSGSAEAARRLFQRSTPIAGTLASTYLRGRGIGVTPDMAALRFHPRCWYRREADSPDGGRDAWPAMIAAVTDSDGVVTGVHRTWLDPSGRGKAPVAVPRRAIGHLLGHAVRVGPVRDVLAAGEGIETMLSLRQVLPILPLAAALSAAHLAAMTFPPGLRRLYVVRDNDNAGRRAAEALMARAQAEGITALTLASTLSDLNDDLCQLGSDMLAASIRSQLAPEDDTRFWQPPNQTHGSTQSA